jgi:hypothetical protein
MRDFDDLNLQNRQADKATGQVLPPLPFEVRSVKDLGALREAWSQRDGVPCLIARREEATDNSFLGLDIRTF